MDKFTELIQQAANEAFNAGEVESIVAVPMKGGPVVSLRAQPEENRPKSSFLSRILPRVLRDRKRVGEGMGE